MRLILREWPILKVRVGGVKVEVVLGLETTFSVGVGGGVAGWLAGENRIKAISKKF